MTFTTTTESFCRLNCRHLLKIWRFLDDDNGITAAITAGASVDTILGLLFGGMMAASAVNELRLMRTPQADRRWWWYHHMDQMLSSYVAATTAFMVQMGVRLAPPEIAWIFWVAPSVIGVPLIAYWKMWYRRQFGQARVDGTAVTQP